MVQAYQPYPGVQDELMEPGGVLRAHWRPLLEGLARMGVAGVNHAAEVARRQLRERGVFHRIYGDSGGGGGERAWPLEPLPLVISAQDWARIEAGVLQRAALMEQLIADIYGPGAVFADGLLPPAAVVGHPDYLRSLVGHSPRGGRFLQFYAVDLGRGPDGDWWVLGDRAQAPSGVGYALENRIAIAQAFPNLFERDRVQRLAGFFDTHRTALGGMVEAQGGRVGLLTPGPLNETYYEHVYLARYLGFPLVEGADLMVMDDRLFLRTVAGPMPLDVLVRRLDGDFCDPLEFNPASEIGVPGLARAVRAGSVSMVNALGVGVLEARSLLAFLPRIAEAWNNAPLDLPHAATWWCGQPAARQTVLERLDDMALSHAQDGLLPAFLTAGQPGPPAGTVLGRELDADQRAQLADYLERRGIDIVGQEVMQLSTTPVWTEDGLLEPHPCSLRVYLTATEDGWSVMPGGFCRIAPHGDARALSMQRGSLSADVWVISDTPVSRASLLPDASRVPVRRNLGALPSRAADNLFWLGRYLERTDATLRLMRGYIARLSEPDWAAEATRAGIAQQLQLWSALALDPALHSAGRLPIAVLQGTGQAGGLSALGDALYRTASALRDRLSPDVWRTIMGLNGVLQAPWHADISQGEALPLVSDGLRLVSALGGLFSENYVRHMGWRFFEAGRRIERAIAMCRLLLRFGGDAAGEDDLKLLLEFADAQMAYRQHYTVGPVRHLVVDLILLDETSPRSVLFQAASLEALARSLPRVHAGPGPGPVERPLIRLLADLRTADVADAEADMFADIEARLLTVAWQLANDYFAPRAPQADVDGP